jgi:hypothetical protein
MEFDFDPQKHNRSMKPVGQFMNSCDPWAPRVKSDRGYALPLSKTLFAFTFRVCKWVRTFAV